jgi:N-acetylmuramic acid 6-phosphate (MurNAc-6-P) etherase
MNIRIFDLERIQSLYENTVLVNLTESGFHPYTLKELLSAEQIEMLTETVLTNGSIPLRQTIAACVWVGYIIADTWAITTILQSQLAF